ncbi:RagB/SusD family nutrient uptake outer membrane protein [Mucilaginibacter sp. Bleaf8]|uniref:RagB/SusD family nutrient uptake outer membrane protein n=1 Tax=Mucilaginibacter sp. Bleaf8 TaxID=2834430 RepID=UPI001BCE7EA6|nr:RagB/SusD family nutrient uptake outer membrane protein [Mucilaginibacter sp. Bleaf8]MBS7566999.1 RagB/SusD family nutrient uptake outer membrane protein [Mucilaginibacter sp. Bleaf8]
MKNKLLMMIALAGTVSVTSCKKGLDENAYSVLLADNFYNNKNEVLSAVLRPYTHANAWVSPSGQDGWWRAAELSGDQLAWPTKGRHGEDGSKWKRLHYHTWTTDEGGLNQAWVLMYWGMGLCNSPIENIEAKDAAAMGITQAEKDAYIAELKLLRAFHYLKIMDLWGNVPVVTKVGTPAKPETLSRTEVFNFIEKEIKDNINKAPKLSRQMMGRMSQAGAYAMLVELYLNAEVWTGTPRWDDCIAAADQLINNAGGAQNGTMALDPNITDQFKTTNDLSKEVIFSIAYDYKVANFSSNWASEFYHFNQSSIYGGAVNGNDGIVVVPGVYTTYDAADQRRSNWLLIGPQYRFEKPDVAVLGSEEYNLQPLVFVDNIRRNKTGSTVSNMSEGEENSGVRFNKYKLGNLIAGPNNTPQPDANYRNGDWNIYRLTWVYFAKAEALMRKNGGVANATAVQLINDCKKRAFSDADWATRAYTTSTLTMDELLAERGREFIFEGFRRDDLIRFGKFTTGIWWDHNPTSAVKSLYPIPQRQRDLNVNLKQNPGY